MVYHDHPNGLSDVEGKFYLNDKMRRNINDNCGEHSNMLGKKDEKSGLVQICTFLMLLSRD